ncbi:MAG: ATP-binding protein [Planctomycetota bacterium]
MAEQIKFEVETQRVLEILSKEIYDSPLALLRENVQNAYDAILMRCARDEADLETGRIDITLQGNHLRIRDNGIGMTEDVLRNNFWKAGSSGKRTQLASQAGVIGTFGIGAMANFGIATQLELITKSRDSAHTLKSVAHRNSLSIAEECISLDRVQDGTSEGTEVAVTLEQQARLSPAQAKQYLQGYIKYVPVKIYLNAELISDQVLDTSVPFSTENLNDLGTQQVSGGPFSFTVHLAVNPQGMVRAEITDFNMGGAAMAGSMLLSQGAGSIMGYRNFFGLAAIPVSTVFQLGGIANLSFLTPTAGREALSRESIAHVQQIVNATEQAIAQRYAETDFADRSNVFLTYITRFGRYDLASKVTIEVHPERDAVALSDVRNHANGRNVYYYTGRDQSLINQFATPQSALLVLSQNNPRRQIQSHYITNTLRISQIPDRATVTKRFSPRELTMAEAALSIRIATTLADDYFLNDFDVVFVEVTHGVQFMVEGNQQKGKLLVARNGPSVRPLLQCYDTSPEVFTAFVKDFVRSQVYPHIKNLVPSSTQGGAEALRKLLKRNRELYRYEETDFGELDPILSDYLSGQASLGDAIRRARSTSSPQRQSIQVNQVGSVESVIKDVTDSPSGLSSTIETEPRPAIIREDIECQFKILTTPNQHANLNNFKLFLGLSDKLFKREAIFFRSPHTTRVMWGGHRVIYIFDHPSGSMTLYYDIELRTALAQHQANGQMLPTTTLILKNRLFVPVPSELEEEFMISQGEKQFYVNFDTIP